MEEITNPYLSKEDYNCFGCSPNNKYGLQMKFMRDGDKIISDWEPKPQFAGYKNVVHGGIISTLIDEVAAWAVSVLLEATAVTSKLEVKYIKPIFTDKGKIRLKAEIVKKSHKLVNICVKIYNNENNLCTEGSVFYYIMDTDKTKKILFD